MGPVISPESKERVERLIESGIKQVGWQLLRLAAGSLGGTYNETGSQQVGWQLLTAKQAGCLVDCHPAVLHSCIQCTCHSSSLQTAPPWM